MAGRCPLELWASAGPTQRDREPGRRLPEAGDPRSPRETPTPGPRQDGEGRGSAGSSPGCSHVLLCPAWTACPSTGPTPPRPRVLIGQASKESARDGQESEAGAEARAGVSGLLDRPGNRGTRGPGGGGTCSRTLPCLLHTRLGGLQGHSPSPGWAEGKACRYWAGGRLPSRGQQTQRPPTPAGPEWEPRRGEGSGGPGRGRRPARHPAACSHRESAAPGLLCSTVIFQEAVTHAETTQNLRGVTSGWALPAPPSPPPARLASDPVTQGGLGRGCPGRRGSHTRAWAGQGPADPHRSPHLTQARRPLDSRGLRRAHARQRRR